MLGNFDGVAPRVGGHGGNRGHGAGMAGTWRGHDGGMAGPCPEHGGDINVGHIAGTRRGHGADMINHDVIMAEHGKGHDGDTAGTWREHGGDVVDMVGTCARAHTIVFIYLVGFDEK